jgi:crotonobetainyl-CoA:carnitine CoA-transferase CaiB-like acyl-CoA transferase
LAANPKFNTLAQRHANAAELDRIISAWTANQDAAELVALLQQRGVAAGKSQSSVDLIADQHLWARDFYHEVTDSDGSTRPIVGPGWKMSRGAIITDGAPRLGEHNAYVFGEILGLSAAEQERLAESGITR